MPYIPYQDSHPGYHLRLSFKYFSGLENKIQFSLHITAYLTSLAGILLSTFVFLLHSFKHFFWRSHCLENWDLAATINYGRTVTQAQNTLIWITGLIPHTPLLFYNLTSLIRLCLTWWEIPEVLGFFRENEWWIIATLGKARKQLSWHEKIKINWPVPPRKGDKVGNRAWRVFTALLSSAFALFCPSPTTACSTLALMSHIPLLLHTIAAPRWLLWL